MNGRKERPDVIGWGITRNCNLSCPHCYSASTRRLKDELTTRECLKLVDSMIDLGVQTIGWTGGEPLLRYDLEEIVFYAKSKGNIRSGVTTNGIPLTERRALSLRQAGVSFIQISLDGSTPERNAQMRNATKEDFHRIIGALRTCQKLGFKMSLAMMLGVENLDDGPEFIRLARREGVPYVRFCGFVPLGRGRKTEIVRRLCFTQETLPRLKSFFEKALSNSNPIVMPDPGFGPLPTDYCFHPCVSGVKTFYLSSVGDVYPCTSLLDKKFLVGNVRERTLQDLWNDPGMTSLSSFPKEKITGYCSECRYLESCRGGCRGITFAHTNDLHASFPLCLSRLESRRPFPAYPAT
ncbi:MAG: radical SAM protein [Candidatus Zixiibacteriota bacterium]|nr:MAG: radical SAM protein [candidate division Zixibacteria bacterium]